MADHVRVQVYVPAHDARGLRAEGLDPAEWVRELVRGALDQRLGVGGVQGARARSSTGLGVESPGSKPERPPENSSNTGKRKLYSRAGCLEKVPEGERCESCGAVHQP